MEAEIDSRPDEPSSKGSYDPCTSASKDKKENTRGTFMCSLCSLTETYDFKGTKPPFARQISYLEDCYVMKDPFSLPNRGEVLILGAHCNVCKEPVCLGCSIFYGKRFCKKCAFNNIHDFPPQLHSKIQLLIKESS